MTVCLRFRVARKTPRFNFGARRLLLADVFIPDGGIRTNVVSEEFRAFFGVEVDDFDAKRAKPIYATLEIAAFTHDYFLKAKLADEAAAIPARSKCRDHDEIAVAALAASIAEGVGFAVERRIAQLHATIVARAEEFPFGIEDRRSNRDAAFGEAFACFGEGGGKKKRVVQVGIHAGIIAVARRLR